jgi:hypothetical protein
MNDTNTLLLLPDNWFPSEARCEKEGTLTTRDRLVTPVSY